LLATCELREIVELYWHAQDQGGLLSWGSVLSAARERAQQLGVSGALWQRQCDLLGAHRTALCVIVADRNAERSDDYWVRNAAQAFVGMTRHEARKGRVIDSLLDELVAFAGGHLK